MNLILKAGSLIGLGLTVIPAFFVFAGALTWDTHAWLMALGALVWFVTAPFWLVKEDEARNPSHD